MFNEFKERLYQKSIVVVDGVKIHMRTILTVWVMVMSFASGIRIAFAATPTDGQFSGVVNFIPYSLIIFAPVVAFLLASKIFPQDALLAQPEIRLARYGRWKTINCLDVRNYPFFGATGLMASLVIGMLINVPFRSAEFLLSVPALGNSAPIWLSSLFTAMTVDLIIMNSLYVVAFVMAIRHVPWFPRFLLLVWGIDICSQLAVAHFVSITPNVPAAVGNALAQLLIGNLQKVAISMVIWLPYLLLSERVNLTYRSRLRVG